MSETQAVKRINTIYSHNSVRTHYLTNRKLIRETEDSLEQYRVESVHVLEYDTPHVQRVEEEHHVCEWMREYACERLFNAPCVKERVHQLDAHRVKIADAELGQYVVVELILAEDLVLD